MLFGKPKNDYNMTLALGAIFQAILLIKNLAKTGKVDEKIFVSCIDTIYPKDTKDVEAIYGGFESLYPGLQELLKFFDIEKKARDPDVTRYLLGLICLERKLMHNEKLCEKLKTSIAQRQHQRSYFEPMHPIILSNLADTYIQTTGALNYRIQIIGRATYLHRQDVMNKIRALLLAGLRSAVLWRQMGGSRWQLLVGRKQISTIALKLCQACEKTHPLEI